MSDARLTRRHLLAGAGLAAASAGLAACGSSAPTATAPASPSPKGTTPGGPATTGTPTTAAAPSPSFDEAAFRRKVASILCLGFRGETVGPNSWIIQAIKQGLGGIILFDTDILTKGRRNISSPSQVKALIATCQQAGGGKLIVSIDQEGGQIARLNPSDGFPPSKSEAEIGAANDLAGTTAWAQGMVTSMTSIGVNMNYAPVVDLNINKNNPAIGALGRSFSADPNIVVRNAAAEIQVHRAAHVKTSPKHFPGFGSATGNTDFGVVDVSKTWTRKELIPYQQLLADKLLDSVLVTHLLNTQIDPSLPMSLSHAAITGLLRGQLGWQGPVVSDDMQATALTSRYGRQQAFQLAFTAGMDFLVYANQQVYDPNIFTETLDSAVALLKTGKLTEAQVDAAVSRVNQLRPA